MDNDNMRTALVRISELARDSHSSEFAETLLRVQGLAESAINQLPPAPVAEELIGEPVAWMHDKNGRVDVIHKDVKKLLGDWDATNQGTGEGYYRKLATVEHYTIPLYTHPQPAVPEGFDIRRNSNGDIIVTRLSDMGAAAYSKGSPIVTEVMGWLFIDALLTATPVKPAVPDVDALAEFIRDIDDGEYIPYHEFAQKICNWIEEQNNDQ